MFTGINFMPAKTLVESTGLEKFKFFTVDSNILIGIFSLILLVYETKYIKGSIKEIPKMAYILKLIGTSGVFLTFATTLILLVPKYGFYINYNNYNLLFHLFVPILALVSYIFFEKHENRYLNALYALIPMGIYSVYYITNVLINYDEAVDINQYDFYRFLKGDINNIYTVIPLVFLAGYGLSLLTVYLNKKFAK